MHVSNEESQTVSPLPDEWVLAAMKLVQSKWWPDIDLSRGLQLALENAVRHQTGVRVFWKDVESVFLGCNSLFANDAGVKEPRLILGLDDLSPRIAWGGNTQAFVFRRDDRRVLESNRAKLDIVERQRQADGTVRWLQTSKAPIHDDEGTTVGLFGMYEVISSEEAARRGLRLNS